MKSLGAFALLLSFFLIGCTGQKVNHCTLLDSERIESMCNVNLTNNFPGYGTECGYVEQGRSEFYYSFSNLSQLGDITLEGMKAELDNSSIIYEEIDLADGAIYRKHAFTMDGRIEGYARTLYFEKGGSLYMVSINHYTNSSEDDPVHCSSKEGLITLADEIG